MQVSHRNVVVVVSSSLLSLDFSLIFDVREELELELAASVRWWWCHTVSLADCVN